MKSFSHLEDVLFSLSAHTYSVWLDTSNEQMSGWAFLYTESISKADKGIVIYFAISNKFAFINF